MNKKGLSDVVTTVLIILIVFAAIFIIWIAINQGVLSRVKGVDAQCFNIKLQTVKCANVNGAAGYNYSTVQVRRDAGEADLDHLILLFAFSDGQTKRVDLPTSSALSELDTTTFSTLGVSGAPTAAPASVSVTSAVKLKNNDIRPCPDSEIKLACG